jgi:hypothetical protein
MGIVNQCLQGSVQLAQRIKLSLASGDMSPSQALTIFRRMAEIVKMANESARISMEMERLRLGLPQAVFGITSTDLDPAQALATIRRAASVYERAEMLGLAPLLESSAGKGPNPADASTAAAVDAIFDE